MAAIARVRNQFASITHPPTLRSIPHIIPRQELPTNRLKFRPILLQHHRNRRRYKPFHYLRPSNIHNHTIPLNLINIIQIMTMLLTANPYHPIASNQTHFPKDLDPRPTRASWSDATFSLLRLVFTLQLLLTTTAANVLLGRRVRSSLQSTAVIVHHGIS